MPTIQKNKLQTFVVKIKLRAKCFTGLRPTTEKKWTYTYILVLTYALYQLNYEVRKRAMSDEGKTADYVRGGGGRKIGRSQVVYFICTVGILAKIA